jgi:TPR repeat protein
LENQAGKLGLLKIFLNRDAMAVISAAAKKGVAAAQGMVGLQIAWGRDKEARAAESREWFRKAAEQGDAFSQCRLGLMYENGDGVEKDEMHALDLYRKAAENEDEEGLKLYKKLSAKMNEAG